MIEIVGVVTGLLCVWLYIRQNVWAWPLTIISASLFLVLFFDARLYANMGLQGFFIALAIYGWRQWRGGLDGTPIRVRKTAAPTARLLAGITTLMALLLILLLNTDAANAASPIWDSLATAISLTAQWMLAHKMLENWLLWITADIIFIGVYITAGLYLTAVLYFVYLGMATAGYLEWRRSYQSSG